MHILHLKLLILPKLTQQVQNWNKTYVASDGGAAVERRGILWLQRRTTAQQGHGSVGAMLQLMMINEEHNASVK
jgi:hypothetical protein